MKAMILAAGKGTRVAPITKEVPKPMIPIMGKPVVQYLLEHLYQCGVRDIIINTSHLAEKIEDYLRDGDRFGMRIAYSYEGVLKGRMFSNQPIGSAAGMKKIQNFSGYFDETFIVMCGDAIIDLDIQEAIAFHKKNQSKATIVTQRVDPDEVDKYGVLQVDESNKVTLFQEKPKKEEAVSNLINTGIYIFEPEIFEYIPDDIFFDIGGDLLPHLAEIGEAIYAYDSEFEWIDIGNISDVYDVTMKALNKEINGFSFNIKEHAPGVWVGPHFRGDLSKINITPPVYISAGCSVEDNAEIIGPALIGANCEIESGAKVKSSIIFDHSRVSSMATIEDKMIFGDNVIDRSGRSMDIDEAGLRWLINDSRTRKQRCSGVEKELTTTS